MKLPEWLKPAIYGAVAGAVAISIAGFSWGGWVTGGSAREMAADQARLEVVAALVPVCVEQSKQDPNVIATLASLEGESSYRVGHHAGLDRSRPQRREGLYGQAGRAVLARPNL